MMLQRGVQTGEYSTSRQIEYFAVGEAEGRLRLLLIGLEVTAYYHSQIKVHLEVEKSVP